MQFGLTITFPAGAGDTKAHWHLYQKDVNGELVRSCAMGYGDSVVDAASAAEKYYKENCADSRDED